MDGEILHCIVLMIVNQNVSHIKILMITVNGVILFKKIKNQADMDNLIGELLEKEENNKNFYFKHSFRH